MLLDLALSVAASGFPVFPTCKKIPVWSNKELGVGPSEGGYKIATVNPDQIRRLFDHPRATDVAVPTGEASGLLCVDVDTYKGTTADWVRNHYHLLKDARIHTTANGGTHYIFKHPKGITFPAAPPGSKGIDIKTNGGYICWAGSKGYAALIDKEPPEISQELILILQGSKTNNSEADAMPSRFNLDEFEQKIKSATSLYPSLRAIALSLANFQIPFNDIIEYLRGLMRESVAANPSHSRHTDWLNRFSKIPTLALSAVRKCKTEPSNESKENLNNQTKLSPVKINSFEDLATDPIEWLVPAIIPQGGTIGLAGASGVGKTRWLTALAICAATRSFENMGFPNAEIGHPVLWIANEERVDDLKRRINAFALHYNISTINNISLIGKESGGVKIASSKHQKVILEYDRLTEIADYINENNCKLLILDPYVSLSAGVSENNAESVSMLRDAFNYITGQTNCSIVFAHHTPKRETSKKPNWYSGMETAFRGSSDIFAQLDVAFTIAPWFPEPENENEYDEWIKNYQELNLSRFITLNAVKMREGIPPKPIIYEICSQIIGNSERIGFCKLSTEKKAFAALNQENNKDFRRFSIASTLINALGIGTHKNATQIYNIIKHLPYVPETSFKSNGSIRVRGALAHFFQSFQSPIQVGKVTLEIRYLSEERTWAAIVKQL